MSTSMDFNMSVFTSSETISQYNDLDIDKNSSKGVENGPTRQSIHNESDRNTQKSLLYQALFLHDKSKLSRGTKQTSGSSINNNKNPSGMVSPKGQQAPGHDRSRWTPSHSPSLSSESSTFLPTVSQSQSSISASFNWQSASQSMSSSSKNLQYTSSDTVASASSDIEHQLTGESCQQREQHGSKESHEDVHSDNTMPYVDLAQIDSPGGVFQVLNNQCYEAAISDEMKSPNSEKYVGKIKPSKSLPQGFLQQTVLVNQLRPRQSEKSNHHHRHHHSGRKHPKDDKKVHDVQEKSSSSDFVAPNTPSPLVVCSTETQKTNSVVTDTKDQKKHRYNQTFSALEQSGLMKTTMKTAELLRRSRSLQQELAKLRRDTTLFVECVLNNPQNKHLKDQYQASNGSQNDCHTR